MNSPKSLICLGLLIFFLPSCTKIIRPYKCGPVLDEDGIKVFRSVNDFLKIKPGDIYGSVGASSGYYDAAMAVFLDGVTFYIQDIDAKCLNRKNFNKVLRYYSGFRNTPIAKTNRFYLVMGTSDKTNLPENTFDQIYSNATYHVLDNPDLIMADIYKKLKPEGHLFIRDEFAFNGEIKYCNCKDCESPLPQYEDFIVLMERRGFELVDESRDFGEYPIYKFAKIPAP